jgi:hypothetical protein
MSAAKARSGPATARTWIVRALVLAVLGLAIGAAGGVVGVRTLEPGRAEQPDSLQMMLDSIANGAPSKAAARTVRRSADSLDADTRAQREADSLRLASQGVVVPDVVGDEEGSARVRILGAKLAVGTIDFEDSSLAAGTVLRTQPSPGTPIAPGGVVSITLSNGRTPPGDSAPSVQRP